MLEKLARTRSKLGPKIRAEARTRSSSGFQYSYSLGARDFDARPIPTEYNDKSRFFQNYIDDFNRFHSKKCFEYDKNLTVRNHPKIKKNFDNVSGI